MKRLLTAGPILAFLALPVTAEAALLRDEVATLTHGSLTRPRPEAPGTDAPVRIVAELGGAQTSGNTDTLHLSGDLRLAWVPANNWVAETRARALYEESNDETTANSWGLFQRVDRYLTRRLGIFAGAGMERNVFAGLGRRISSQLGSAYLAIDRRDPEKEDLVISRLRLELGGYAAWEKYTLPPSASPDTVLSEDGNRIFALRGAIGYIHALTRNTSAGIEFEAIQDFVDLDHIFLNTTAYIAIAVIEGLALKIAGTHVYNSVPPDPTLKNSDFITTGNVVVSL